MVSRELGRRPERKITTIRRKMYEKEGQFGKKKSITKRRKASEVNTKICFPDKMQKML